MASQASHVNTTMTTQAPAQAPAIPTGSVKSPSAPDKEPRKELTDEQCIAAFEALARMQHKNPNDPDWTLNANVERCRRLKQLEECIAGDPNWTPDANMERCLRLKQLEQASTTTRPSPTGGVTSRVPTPKERAVMEGLQQNLPCVEQTKRFAIYKGIYLPDSQYFANAEAYGYVTDTRIAMLCNQQERAPSTPTTRVPTPEERACIEALLAVNPNANVNGCSIVNQRQRRSLSNPRPLQTD
jgi:hypothetical protein